MSNEQELKEKPRHRSRCLLWFCVTGCIAFNVFQILSTQSRFLAATSMFTKDKYPGDSQDATAITKTITKTETKTTYIRAAALKNEGILNMGSDFIDENHKYHAIDDSSPVCGFEKVNIVQSKPKEFFENGPGKPFLNNISKNQKKLQRRYVTMKGKGLDHSTNCTRVYFHVHKAGGTTMSRIPNSEKLYSTEIGTYGWKQFHEKLKEVTDQANALQSKDPNSISLFTFVRDPVSRFVSGLGQVLVLNHRYGSNETNYCIDNATPDHFDKDKPDEIDDGSVVAATISLMDCIADTISETGIFLDIHLIPQVYEIYDDMAGYDLVLDIMDMRESIGSVRDQLGGVSSGHDAKVRPGDAKVSHPQFTLSKDTIPPRLIKKICRLYHVDVLYLNSLKNKNNDNQPLINSVCNDYNYMT